MTVIHWLFSFTRSLAFEFDEFVIAEHDGHSGQSERRWFNQIRGVLTIRGALNHRNSDDTRRALNDRTRGKRVSKSEG